MRKNILITGKPGTGKTTILEKIISSYNNKSGFITREIRDESGQRTGFEAINSLGESSVMASTQFNTNIMVSRYHVNVDNLNKMLVPLFSFKKDQLLYMDEIGQMELNSDVFKNLALKYLDSENICVSLITAIFHDDFTDAVKKREDVILVEITPENRDKQYVFIEGLIKKINKAMIYSKEPERFNVGKDSATIRSDHGERHLTRKDGYWTCDCPFYTSNNICSHVLALEEYISRK
ncbi:MAG: nucleoside-triphosphatase [Candidatus Nanoarchaeia archaeon]